MSQSDSSISVRANIIDILKRELIGPDPGYPSQQLNKEEILRPQDPPRLRYSTAILFPYNSAISSSDSLAEDELEATGDDISDEDLDAKTSELSSDGETGSDVSDPDDYEINRANDYLPSAMGLTAIVDYSIELKVTVNAARYVKREVKGLGNPNEIGRYPEHYFRVPIGPVDIIVSQDVLSAENDQRREYSIRTGPKSSMLKLVVHSRPVKGLQSDSHQRIVTFALINGSINRTNYPKDEDCLFQCHMAIRATNDSYCFAEYYESPPLETEQEEASLRLLYRNKRTYAIGHGCAAEWNETKSGNTNKIWTTFLPVFDVKPVIPALFQNIDLSMNKFSNPDTTFAVQECYKLADEYEKWIKTEEKYIISGSLPHDMMETAKNHIDTCRNCHKRLVNGIGLLESNKTIRIAFVLMNEAMLMQQLHYDLSTNHIRQWEEMGSQITLNQEYVKPDYTQPPIGKGTWRPFQIAFILMNLDALSDKNSPEREIVDLIWFPTGGGKTEAYLGLAAFAIFLRRIKDPTDIGTTVIMRYTLRLLTSQQFQRAASLICACEIIRRRLSDTLGRDPISIGLWVGGDLTPNKYKDSTTSLRKLQKDGRDNPFVLLSCPWCGAQMGPVKYKDAYKTPGYVQYGSPRRVELRCPDDNCEFGGAYELPLYVIDEAIYDKRPSIIIGTVDKFALIPWYPESNVLFGKSEDQQVSPPDLIIQDELHLISGALGSVVGIYETTIERLCMDLTGDLPSRPKIVASTATIAHAISQVRSLYARDVFIFPPQGLSFGSSFFAKEDVSLPGRTYVGVMATALSSHVSAQIRVIASLLQSPKTIGQTKNVCVDPYWTLMCYFNSLRELGHAATLIRGDIRDYLNAMWDRMNIRRPDPYDSSLDRRRFINRDLELTSRIQSNRITNTLQELFTKYDPGNNTRAVDICLATNMIQVGLDVPRLGIMVVIGQPKTTSEYIQATSRVGRSQSGPGLVVTVYNPAKPRDRSHYEHFRSYHQMLYKWVEPTSVTPFAVPVRERALHAQVVSLARFMGSGKLRSVPDVDELKNIMPLISEIILNRVSAIDPNEADATEDMLHELFNEWCNFAPLIYGRFGYPPEDPPLMYPAGSAPRKDWDGRGWPTLSSMRNVDATCEAKVIRQYPKEE